jgi:predicted MPP superfamily phosphohydrolase
MWWYLLVILPLAVVLWLLYEWMEHSMVQYNATTVECQKIPQGKELKICLISDLHNNRKNLSKLIQNIALFSPDMILLAGDLVNKHKQINTYADYFLKEIVKLSVPVYYSAGNHELSLSEQFPEAWKKYLANLPDGVYYLENTSVLLIENHDICITGLSLPKEFYKKGKLYDKPEELPEINIPEHKFHILLAHHPEYASMYDKYKADFIVSGHLHGGLLRLPGIGGIVSPRLRLPDCAAGLMELSGSSKIFVSRGLGSHTIPLRFFNRVEVNFLTLKGK